MHTDLTAIVKNYLQALQNRNAFADIAPFYHPQAVQVEYPNTLTKKLVERDLEKLETASDRGKQVLEQENYEVLKAYQCGNTVIVEVIWTATLKVPIGTIHAGEEMKAYFAQVFEFEGNRIIRQRNYDCFEPFE